MDFSVTVPEEWLTRRRLQVAEASRKVRARKKQEEEELRQENAKLREERTALLTKITDLERSIGDLSERDLDLENELLRTQLEQHKGFLKGFLETISSLEPNEKSSKGELSRQNRDFAMTHALRLISESQSNRDNAWKRAEVPFLKGKLQEGSDYSLWYSRPSADSLNIRLDLVTPKADARTFRDLVIKSWTEVDLFNSVFGENRMRSCVELPEFAVDADDEILRAHHAREPSGAKFTDTVFLTATGATVLTKSTLQLGPGRGPLLAQSLPQQEALSSTKKRPKLADPVDWGVCGTANVFYGTRTVTGHGKPEEDPDHPDTERMMSTAIEVCFHWDEEIESTNPNYAGKCVRSIELLTLPVGFKFPAIGGIDDFIDVSGRVGERFFLALYNYVTIGIATVDPSAATKLIRGEVPSSFRDVAGDHSSSSSPS